MFILSFFFFQQTLAEGLLFAGLSYQAGDGGVRHVLMV